MPEEEPNIFREGDPNGSPSVLFDPERRLPYHLDRRGGKVYHAAPDGYRFNDAGELEETPALPEPAELVAPLRGVAVSPAAPAVPPLQGEPLRVPEGTVLPKLEPLPAGAPVKLVLGQAPAPTAPAPDAESATPAPKEG